ncbi:MAG: EF-P lysine aminoacylase EpmA [Patescibacteria group bacterium]
MSHLTHIVKNKKHLELRFEIIRLIREWFWPQGFIEVETPIILRLPGQEPYLSPVKVAIHNEQGISFDGYLHTSPEYTLKKMLAAGFEKIFYLGKVFRDHESFGGTHNPEFTMIEWYRAREDFTAIMTDVEELWGFLVKSLSSKSEIRNPKSDLSAEASAKEETNPNDQNVLKFEHLNFGVVSDFEFRISNFQRLHMRDVWQKYAGVNLDECLDREKMFELCEKKGYKPKIDEPYEDLFYRIFLNEIEPHLGKERPTILHHYPAPMAALSRLSPADPRYAERFEVYVGGLELANCFGELTDPDEQLKRLQNDRANRANLSRDVFGIDMEFIEALHTMPPSSGIALGIDRLVQLFTGCKNIDDVVSLPMSQLFEG